MKTKWLSAQYLFLFSLTLFLQLIVINHLRFTAWPEMTFWPYLMLNNWLPYRDISIVHTPVLLVLLTGYYKVFGLGVQQLQTFTWGLILITDTVLLYVTGKLFSRKIALTALLIFIILQFVYEGNGLWFDLALSPFALLLYYFMSKKQYFLSGIIFVLLFLIKQTASWFIIPLVFMVIDQPDLIKNKLRKLILFGLGVLDGLILMIIILLFYKLLASFLEWTIGFGILTLPKSSGQISFPGSKQLVAAILPFGPLLLLIRTKYRILFIWAVAGIMGVFPRWELFHFQPALPFLAVGLSIFFVDKGRSGYILPLKLLFIITLTVVSIKTLSAEWGKGIRFYDPAVINVGDKINTLTTDYSHIYLLNVWDNLYPLSMTLPANKPWYPHLQWYMDQPGVQENIINDLSDTKPEWIVAFPYTDNGLSGYRPVIVENYVQMNYQYSFSQEGYLFYKRL